MSNIDIENGLVLTEARIWPVRDPQASRVKAMVSLTFNDCIRVNSCRIIEGARGCFLSFPSEKKQGTDEWTSFVHTTTRAGSEKLKDAVIGQWNEMLAAAGPER